MKIKALALCLASLFLLVPAMLAPAAHANGTPTPAADAPGTPTWASAGPIGRAFPSAVLDTTTNRMIVFGGDVAGGFNTTLPFQDLNDVWRLSSGAGVLLWTRVLPSGTPPAPRVARTAVYDAGSNRMIVFGGGLGNSSPCANDVWVLTNANGNGGTPAWIQLSPTGPAPAPRLQHVAGYDPTTNIMIVYGGNNCFSTDFGDVWTLSNANGLGGTPAWTQLSPTGVGPSPRGGARGVYDATNNRLMVFGARTPAAPTTTTCGCSRTPMGRAGRRRGCNCPPPGHSLRRERAAA